MINNIKMEINKTIKMYVCGPTVYDHSHLGHARTYVTVDMIKRTMDTIIGNKTHLVMNITNIDDKIIKKASETNNNWIDIANIYEKSFFDSMKKLNVKLPNVIIRVSEVIPQIILYVQKIIDNGFAYMTSDGSVYFDTNAYISAGYEMDNLIDEEENQYQSNLSQNIISQKKNKKDFALMKSRKPTEVGFNAEFMYQNNKIKNNFMIGWHLECAVMIHETIGPELDIHFGGIDLKFPHHHNEQLQAHAFYHPQFLNDIDPESVTERWPEQFMHIGHLCIKGCKMSKSLKNFTLIDEVLKEFNANQLRWLFALHKWTEPMDYSDNTIEQAKIFDSSIVNFFNRIKNYPFKRAHIVYNKKEFDFSNYYHETKQKMIDTLNMFRFDTMTTLLLELINKTNTYVSMDDNNSNECLVKEIYEWILQLLENLGFVYNESTDSSINDVMDVLIDTRNTIRELTRDKSVPKEIKQKLFEILDIERNIKLPEIGITLQDTKDSSSWFKN